MGVTAPVSLALVGAAGAMAVGASFGIVAGDVAEEAGVQIFCEVAVFDPVSVRGV